MTAPGGNGYNSQQANAQQALQYQNQGQVTRQRNTDRGARAADDLARLMRERLEVTVDATALRRFLLRHWSSVEALAHIIHDNEER